MPVPDRSGHPIDRPAQTLLLLGHGFDDARIVDIRRDQRSRLHHQENGVIPDAINQLLQECFITGHLIVIPVQEEIKAEILAYVKGMIQQTVTGKVDIDTERDIYLEHLESIRLPRYIEILQNAYDAWK